VLNLLHEGNGMDNATAQEKKAQQVLHLLRNFRFKISADIHEVFYSPTDVQVIVLTTIFKFTIKEPRHTRILVQAHHL
jgi:ATP-dependent Clp protease adapter protein ClpS